MTHASGALYLAKFVETTRFTVEFTMDTYTIVRWVKINELIAGKGITLIGMGQVIRVPMHLQTVGHFGI